MNKRKIIGTLLLIAGCAIYFLVSGEPYTTIAGLLAGIGFGILLLGFPANIIRN